MVTASFVTPKTHLGNLGVIVLQPLDSVFQLLSRLHTCSSPAGTNQTYAQSYMIAAQPSEGWHSSL